MLSIKFYNETGSITFGGGKSNSPWRITSAEGLAICGKTFNTARFIGQDGQETTSVVGNARTITISGDITIGENFCAEFSSCLATLDKEGWLEVTSSCGVRRIHARCCDFVQGERKGKYLIFTVQFICDSPYFEDCDRTEVAVFREIPLLDKSFAFPGMFSKRISKSGLRYDGNAKTEPIFFIEINEGTEGNNILALYNRTSGESLKFNYAGVMGECITVDVEKRKIYNADGENLLKYLADDSFFDGFHLYPGVNEIEVINNNMNTGITVICRYSNKYSEAVLI